MSRYQFIASERSHYPVVRMCQVLEVSVSGFYDWLQRETSQRAQANAALTGRIRTVFEQSQQTYGYLRVHAQLRAEGERVGKHRVARLMRLAGLRPRSVKRRRVLTQPAASREAAANVLNQDFSATGPNQKWLVDLTAILTREGWLYLAGVLDVFSRRIVGWSMSDRHDASLPASALKMAIRQRGRPKLHHSDRGSEYTSAAYLVLLEGVTISMSHTGNCYDNAMKESFWGTLKTECADHVFPDRATARPAVFDYIERWYNRQRLHSALGYRSPVAFEQAAGP
jgi:transposase InsO family protein